MMKRNSNIEALRIMAMLFIVLQHCVAHNTVVYQSVYKINFISGLVLNYGMLGRLGVSLFILIFGYFGIRTGLNIKRIIMLCIEVWTISLITYIVIVSIGLQPFSLKDFIKAVLPISCGKYWFISAYVVFSLFVPYINRVLTTITEKQYQFFIAIQVVLWCVLSSLSLHKVSFYCGELEQFLMYYCIGAYLRIYVDPKAGNNLKVRSTVSNAFKILCGGVLHYTL